MLVAGQDPTGKPAPLLMLRADPDEREALLSKGHPFFASRAGRDRIGMPLTDDTDWEEIRELVTESYRILAPKKLTALLDQHRLAVESAVLADMSEIPDRDSNAGPTA